MRPRLFVPVVLSCAAVAMTGCGGSKLLDGDSAADLQSSLSTVKAAIDDGQCAEARSAVREGAAKVEDLPSSVDADLRSTLKTGFDDLSSRISTDCDATSTEAPATTVPDTTTETEPAAPTTTETTPTETAPDTTPIDPTTTDDTTPTDPATPTDPGTGDDGSGGVDPGGVDGPGTSGPPAGERSAPGKLGATIRQRLHAARQRAEDYLRGKGHR